VHSTTMPSSGGCRKNQRKSVILRRQASCCPALPEAPRARAQPIISRLSEGLWSRRLD
jgi:hypothetical protein